MPEIDALMSSADRFRLNSTRSSPLLMECQSLSDVKLGPSACEVQCRTSGQETPSTRTKKWCCRLRSVSICEPMVFVKSHHKSRSCRHGHLSMFERLVLKFF
ncbi:uncharacterized protein LOC141866951 isoform X1 [Acropora palmata]|uniref:uncharacterized protein LOC141866951 isoform X1 n=1 Tax=Acropora palmata TaxID=6131 RepID=UPI003DA1C52B